MIDPRNLIPAPHHALLLRAALHDDAAVAQRALDEWQAQVAPEALDATSVRLLSLLADRTGELRFDPAVQTRVGTIVRFSWLRTQALLAASRPVLADLAGGDIPFLVLKGAALVGADRRGLGRRQLDDVDVLVPGWGVPVVVGTLRARGFDSRIAEGLVARPRQFLDATHSTGFASGPAEIDLHWRAAPLARTAAVEDQRWHDARLVDVAGVRVGIPSATEMLLLAIEHDAVPVPSGGGRWIGDAATLLRDGGVDPIRLRGRAAALGLGAALDQAVETYGDVTGQRLPAGRRRRAPIVERVRPIATDDPRAVALAAEWQRQRARRPAGWRGALGAGRASWAALGGAAALRSAAPVVPVPASAPPGPEAHNPWAWACRRVDLRFGVNDEGVGWLRSGWSSPEPGFTWTDAPHATLELPVDVSPGEPLVLDVVTHGLVTELAPAYTAVWSVDGQAVWRQEVTDGEQRWDTVHVPAGVVTGGTVAVAVDVRWPRSAVEAGTGTDLRRLGVGLSWIRVMSAWSPRPSGDPI